MPLSSEEMNRSSMYLNPKRVPNKGMSVVNDVDDMDDEESNIRPPDPNDVS